MRKILFTAVLILALAGGVWAQTPTLFPINAKYAGYAGTGGGTANAQTITYTPVLAALTVGEVFSYTPANANTGATTLAVNSITAHSVVKAPAATVLVANDLITATVAYLYWDGTNFNLLNPQTATTGLSGLTSGYLPMATSGSTIGNSHCDQGITTANTLTCTNSAGLSMTFQVAVPSDGTHSGLLALIGNTTVPASLPTNSVGLLGPNSASFTSYFLQPSSTAPSNNELMCGPPSSNVSSCTWIAPVAFASLPSCSSTTEGEKRPVTDSTTAVWGATITGSSSNHVLAYCDGTNWTVAAK
jgi:hypothetical protein